MERSTLLWEIGLMLGFPIVSIALAEGIRRLQKQQSLLTGFVENILRFVLPPLAILLVMQQLLGFGQSNGSLQIVATVLWVAITYAALSLLNAVLTSQTKHKTWQIHVPNLLFQFTRALVVLGFAAYALASVWKINLNQIAAALGVGSLVIALALQDTLSNLVSGFLLIFEAPFQVGDWIRSNELEGEVLEINWRAVRIKTRDRDVLVVPNGVLGGSTICNYRLFDPLHVEHVSIGFSRNDPPNKVKRLLQSVALEVKGVVPEPAPEILTTSYGEFSIQYDVLLYIEDPVLIPYIRDEFLTRIHYVAKRNRLRIPVPISIEYATENEAFIHEEADDQPHILASLEALSHSVSFDRDTIEELAKHATLEHYGAGERLVQAGDLNPGFCIILEGSVVLSVPDSEGREQEVATLAQGELFGEMALLPGEPSLVSVKVIDDLETLVIDPDAISAAAQKSSKFASEMNQLIEKRRKAVQVVKKRRDGGNRDQEDEHTDTYTSLMERLVSNAELQPKKEEVAS